MQKATGNSIVGTERYLAPELAFKKGKADPNATDIWCLGATAFHLLTNRDAFPSRDELESYTLGRVGHPLHRLREPLLSSAASNFITAAMDAEPVNRFSAGQALNHQWIIGDDDIVEAPRHVSSYTGYF